MMSFEFFKGMVMVSALTIASALILYVTITIVSDKPKRKADHLEDHYNDF